jgi:hypothetical protein
MSPYESGLSGYGSVGSKEMVCEQDGSVMLDASIDFPVVTQNNKKESVVVENERRESCGDKGR